MGAEDARDEVSRVRSTLGVIKALFGSLGCIGAGVFLIHGPPEAREEISRREELAPLDLDASTLSLVLRLEELDARPDAVHGATCDFAAESGEKCGLERKRR